MYNDHDRDITSLRVCLLINLYIIDYILSGLWSRDPWVADPHSVLWAWAVSTTLTLLLLSMTKLIATMH